MKLREKGGSGMEWSAGRGDAYQLLAGLARRIWHLDPLPPIERKPGGKPWLPERPDCHFSVSDSGELALCAVSDCSVGVDLEIIRPRREMLPAYVCSSAELDWYTARGKHWEDFYILWTMKEAWVKCTGEGLRIRPREIRIPLPAGESVLELDGFRYTLLSDTDWRGAVCEQLK